MVNESLWHAERGFFRAVTGQSSLFPGADGVPAIGTFPAKGTIPVARTLTGTISSASSNGYYVVLGVGTSFLSEVQVDDFIYDGDVSLRKVISVISDTQLILEHSFPSDLSGVALKVCKPQIFKKVQAKSTGTVDAKLQETIFKVGDDTPISGGAPISYDASASNAQISFSVSK